MPPSRVHETLMTSALMFLIAEEAPASFPDPVNPSTQNTSRERAGEMPIPIEVRSRAAASKQAVAAGVRIIMRIRSSPIHQDPGVAANGYCGDVPKTPRFAAGMAALD